MRIISSAFQAGEPIPSIYTCEGENKNPELVVEEVPEATMSFALVMDDPDAPAGVFTHWLIWNIDGRARRMDEGLYAPEGVTEGVNGSGKRGYLGPCPPEGHGTHHYRFHIYALDSM